MIVVLGFLAVFAYIVAGAAIGMILFKCQAVDDMGSTIAAIIWPAVLPIMLGMRLGHRVANWITAPKRVAEALRKQ